MASLLAEAEAGGGFNEPATRTGSGRGDRRTAFISARNDRRFRWHFRIRGGAGNRRPPVASRDDRTVSSTLTTTPCITFKLCGSQVKSNQHEQTDRNSCTTNWMTGNNVVTVSVALERARITERTHSRWFIVKVWRCFVSRRACLRRSHSILGTRSLLNLRRRRGLFLVSFDLSSPCERYPSADPTNTRYDRVTHSRAFP